MPERKQRVQKKKKRSKKKTSSSSSSHQEEARTWENEDFHDLIVVDPNAVAVVSMMMSIPCSSDFFSFVSKFHSIMLRFPAYCGQLLSRAEEDHVREFFVRVARFSSKGGSFPYNPLHPITAFMIVNYPEETLHCHCNPFRSSILHRSLRFVCACFQVVIDCSREEDDGAADFLPPTTALKYFSSLVGYMEVLRMYSLFFKSKPCQCDKKENLAGPVLLPCFI
jgi:hypothetical protein